MFSKILHIDCYLRSSTSYSGSKTTLLVHFSFVRFSSSCFRKVPLAAESLLSPSGTSSIPSHQAPSPTSCLLNSLPNSLSYTAMFPQSASTAGVFNIRDSPQPHTQVFAQGKARNGTHKASRPSKDVEEPVAGTKKRKKTSYSSSSFSSSSLFPTVDNYKRNDRSFHSQLQSSGGTAASPAKKKGLGHGDSELWGSSEGWLSKADGPQSHISQNR